MSEPLQGSSVYALGNLMHVTTNKYFFLNSYIFNLAHSYTVCFSFSFFAFLVS